ncbi:plasminogen-like [Branchiostoma floridae x Branchiostoma belcheri]
MTLTGKTCQMWASQKPHHSLYNTPYRLPQAGLRKNFCRTPDADRCPWCYTMDPKTRWEYCFVCEKETVNLYGTVSRMVPHCNSTITWQFTSTGNSLNVSSG